MEEKFKIGEKVRVISEGCNASRFSRKYPHVAVNGVYSLIDWATTDFTISKCLGMSNFSNTENSNVYALELEGEVVGCVYEYGLQKVVGNLLPESFKKVAYEIKEEDQKALEEAMKPLMKYLAENHHPHVTAIVTATSGEIAEGLGSVNTYEFLKD